MFCFPSELGMLCAEPRERATRASDAAAGSINQLGQTPSNWYGTNISATPSIVSKAKTLRCSHSMFRATCSTRLARSSLLTMSGACCTTLAGKKKNEGERRSRHQPHFVSASLTTHTSYAAASRLRSRLTTKFHLQGVYFLTKCTAQTCIEQQVMFW